MYTASLLNVRFSLWLVTVDEDKMDYRATLLKPAPINKPVWKSVGEPVSTALQKQQKQPNLGKNTEQPTDYFTSMADMLQHVQWRV